MPLAQGSSKAASTRADWNAFPSMTLKDLKAAVARHESGDHGLNGPLPEDTLAKIRKEIAERESGASTHRPTPQVGWGRKDSSMTKLDSALAACDALNRRFDALVARRDSAGEVEAARQQLAREEKAAAANPTASAKAAVRKAQALLTKAQNANGPFSKVTALKDSDSVVRIVAAKDRVTGKPSRNVVIEAGGMKQVILRSVDPTWSDDKIKSYINSNYGSKLKAAGAVWK